MDAACTLSSWDERCGLPPVAGLPALLATGSWRTDADGFGRALGQVLERASSAGCRPGELDDAVEVLADVLVDAGEPDAAARALGALAALLAEDAAGAERAVTVGTRALALARRGYLPIDHRLDLWLAAAQLRTGRFDSAEATLVAMAARDPTDPVRHAGAASLWAGHDVQRAYDWQVRALGLAVAADDAALAREYNQARRALRDQLPGRVRRGNDALDALAASLG